MRPKCKPVNYFHEIQRQADSEQKQLYVAAMFNPANGYGDLAKHFCVEASRMIDLGIIPHGGDTRVLQRVGLMDRVEHRHHHINSLLSIQPTFSLMQHNNAKAGAMFTMFETSKLRPEWIRAMNTYKIVITPSHFNAADFSEQLTVPVEVANMGHDHNLFTLHPYPRKGPFIFGAAAHVGHGRTRKGIERIIDWFCSAFPDQKDVMLSLKLNAYPENGIIPNDPRIAVIEQDLSDEDCRDWLRSIHCYIDGSTFEGWGMWNHHAMATGRPVIGSNYSARCEYFKFGNHIPIGYRVTPASDQYVGLGHWAMPDRSDAIEAMRWAFQNPSKCRAIGKKAHQTVSLMTWKMFAKRVLRILKKHQIVLS
jgi:glycosyltransferase involved in cell wall biosynthesis